MHSGAITRTLLSISAFVLVLFTTSSASADVLMWEWSGPSTRAFSIHTLGFSAEVPAGAIVTLDVSFDTNAVPIVRGVNSGFYHLAGTSLNLGGNIYPAGVGFLEINCPDGECGILPGVVTFHVPGFGFLAPPPQGFPPVEVQASFFMPDTDGSPPTEHPDTGGFFVTCIPLALGCGTSVAAEISTVPEPTTVALLGSGLAGLAGFAWRRRRR